MKEYLELNGNKYEISGYKDGVPVIKGIVKTKDEGVDLNGIPKRSVEVIVPCAIVKADVGQNGGVE